ncbi:hypothetical protein D3C75_426860 [compost metagenome]
MGGTHDFVMLPTLTVTIFPVPVGLQKLTVPIGKCFTLLLEVAKPVQKFTHRISPVWSLWLSKSTLLICGEGNALKDDGN